MWRRPEVLEPRRHLRRQQTGQLRILGPILWIRFGLTYRQNSIYSN
jgi:hypothetical protein